MNRIWSKPGASRRAEFPKDLLDLIVGSEAAFARSLQAPIDSFKFLRRRVIRAGAKARFNLKRDLCKFDLSRLRPILDTPQHVLKDLGCHAATIACSFQSKEGLDSTICVQPHPSATASLHGWNASVAPLLVLPSRSTTLGQANFIGRVWMRASS